MLHWNRRLLCETWLFTIVGYIWAIYGASLCSLMPSASSSTDVGGNGESGESNNTLLFHKQNHQVLLKKLPRKPHCPSLPLTVKNADLERVALDVCSILLGKPASIIIIIIVVCSSSSSSSAESSSLSLLF